MKKCFFLLSAALTSLSACFAQEIPAKLDELMTAYVKDSRFNGSVLVARDGKILLHKGYGLQNAAAGSANDSGSVFLIGSATKQMTAALVLKLQEMKKLSVKDKVSKYFPKYPKGDSITIENLLQHTSGIYNYTRNQEFMEAGVFQPQDRRSMLALFQDKPLDFSPGTQWKYSNSAYSLLGYIIEDVSGMSYYAAMRKYVLSPAKMNESGFDFARLVHAKKATGYSRLNDRNSIPAKITDSSVSYSAGAIYATTGDLYRWNQALWNNAVINKTSTALALVPGKNKYGYGLFVDSLYGKLKQEHSGSIPGFNSNMVAIPADRACVILLSNVNTPFLDTITKSLLAILYEKPYTIPEERKAFIVPEEKLKEYAGVYDAAPGPLVTISLENGKLIGQPAGQDALELHPEKEDLFYIKEVDARMRFDRDEKKQIVSMALLQRGQEIKAIRKP